MNIEEDIHISHYFLPNTNIRIFYEERKREKIVSVLKELFVLKIETFLSDYYYEGNCLRLGHSPRVRERNFRGFFDHN